MTRIVCAVVAIIGFVVVSKIFEDPRIAAMNACVRGIPDAQKQIECARAIFGGK